MSDCPHCDWRYDPMAAPIVARPVDNWLPVVWEGARLHVASPLDEPNGYFLAVGTHICEEHWLEPEVLLLGPVRFQPFF